MRLVTWNLRNGAGRPLWPRLQADIQADIGFLQESDATPDGANVLWRQVPGAQWGSAVVTTLGSIRPIELSGYEGWVVGGHLQAARRALAVFSVHVPSSTKTMPREPYATEAIRIITLIRAAVPPDTDVVIGGDFNVTLGERHPSESLRTAHSDRLVLQAIASAGLVSCWTAAHAGEPLPQTLRWTGDRSPGRTTPYHCDGILVPQSWAPGIRCDILTDERHRISDHNPVSASVSPTARGPGKIQ